ncbi:MAG: DUF2934 domain-containing protein [Terracidiphilus sp.]
MIVTKVKTHSKQDRVIARQPSAAAESTTSGIRVSLDDIRVRAFHMYQRRGGQHGHDIQDWLKAERQITQR